MTRITPLPLGQVSLALQDAVDRQRTLLGVVPESLQFAERNLAEPAGWTVGKHRGS